MTRSIFTNEHLEGFYESIRASRRQAELDLEVARLKEIIVGLIDAGGSALHSIFEAGGEPKWRHPSEREGLVELSNALHAAFSTLSAPAQ